MEAAAREGGVGLVEAHDAQPRLRHLRQAVLAHPVLDARGDLRVVRAVGGDDLVVEVLRTRRKRSMLTGPLERVERSSGNTSTHGCGQSRRITATSSCANLFLMELGLAGGTSSSLVHGQARAAPRCSSGTGVPPLAYHHVHHRLQAPELDCPPPRSRMPRGRSASHPPTGGAAPGWRRPGCGAAPAPSRRTSAAPRRGTAPRTTQPSRARTRRRSVRGGTREGRPTQQRVSPPARTHRKKRKMAKPGCVGMNRPSTAS